MNLKISLVIIGLILLYIPGAAFAQFEGAVWEILTSDSMQHMLSQSPIAASSSGLHITYARSRGIGEGWDIFYRYFSPYYGWDDPVIVDATNPAWEPSISAREFGTFRIAVFYIAEGDIYGDVVFSPWQMWTPVNLTNTDDNDYSVTSAIDIEGTVHLSWITETAGQYKIAYGKIQNGTFSMEVLQNSDLGDYGLGAAPFITTVDTIPHIFYRGISGYNYHIHHAYNNPPDSSWVIEFLFTPNLDDYVASAAVDSSGEIHLSLSGNTGWGTPGRVYYRKRSYPTGDWSSPDLVSDTFSIVDGHLGVTEGGVVFIAGAGVAGNVYTGDIYLSDNSSGFFETEFLVNYPDGIKPAVAFLPGPLGALIMQGRISHPGYENNEIIYYGPQQTSVEFAPELPDSIGLCRNYPNPFNSNTIISINGTTGFDARLSIFDILGRKIAELSPYMRREDGLCFKWDGSDALGERCPSGAYFYAVDNACRRINGRMVYLK